MINENRTLVKPFADTANDAFERLTADFQTNIDPLG